MVDKKISHHVALRAARKSAEQFARAVNCSLVGDTLLLLLRFSSDRGSKADRSWISFGDMSLAFILV